MREKLWLSLAEMPYRTANILSEACAEAIARHGSFNLALSGGSSPEALFRALRWKPEAVDWPRTRVFQVDERCVPQDHELCNFSMMCRELLDHVPVSPQNMFPMCGTGEPEAAARAYAAVLATYAQDGLDCVILGMGTDGHTASLFPDTPQLAAETPTAVSHRPDATRLTLTFPVINAAKLALFYVPGVDKAPMLRQVLAPSTPEDVIQTAIPARRVKARRVVWVMNEVLR